MVQNTLFTDQPRNTSPSTSSISHVKKTIKKNLPKYQKNLKCKFCSDPDAWISEEDNRYYVNCPKCQQTYLLKEQREKEQEYHEEYRNDNPSVG